MSSNRADSDEVESNAQASIQGATSSGLVAEGRESKEKEAFFHMLFEWFSEFVRTNPLAQRPLLPPEVRDTNVSKVSYKTKLLGTSSNQNPSANMEEPFELQDEDMVVESNFLLRAISQVIDTVVKIDAHTTVAVKGRFAKMVVCVDLNKPLASKVRINGRLQMVEYDALPNVCFTYGLYGYSSSLYLERQATK
ncbi:hypothetical protein Golob_000839, partial [Gossypium lobatum]|nr:hypothetical protein [Gossypium lobatum]